MENPQIVILYLLLVFPALFAVGVLWVQFVNLKTLSWRRANGRIVSSRIAARDVRNMSTGGGTPNSPRRGNLERRNFVSLKYEFKVDGKAYQGDRIDLGVKSVEGEIVEKMRRYPEGKIVSVLYDPRDPSRCILERFSARDIVKSWLAIFLIVALIFGGVYGVAWIAEVIRSAIPRPAATPFVVFLAGFALVLALAGVAIARKGRQMSGWPQVEGEVVESAVATTTMLQGGTTFTPRVVYRYAVGQDVFQGDNVGSVVSSSNAKGPNKAVARHAVGSRVKVFFNPENPTESTIAPRVGLLPPIFWLLAVGVALAALATAGFTPHW